MNKYNFKNKKPFIIAEVSGNHNGSLKKMLKIIQSKEKYCVFDIGSDKLVCLFFKIKDNKPYILGMDHQKSNGFLSDNEIDQQKLSLTIAKAVKKSLPKNSN